MSANLTDSTAVLRAVKEYDEWGRRDFLALHGLGATERSCMQSDGRLYDPGAIATAALRHQRGDTSVVVSSGAERGHRALERLGFALVAGKPHRRGRREGVASRPVVASVGVLRRVGQPAFGAAGVRGLRRGAGRLGGQGTNA